jgi:hypothetical protein
MMDLTLKIYFFVRFNYNFIVKNGYNKRPVSEYNRDFAKLISKKILQYKITGEFVREWDSIIEAKETFSGLHSEANIEFQVNLANPIKQDTIPMVFINSDFALQIGHSNGENGIFITVPYVVDEGDVVTVIYKYSA